MAKLYTFGALTDPTRHASLSHPRVAVDGKMAARLLSPTEREEERT